MSHLRVTGGTNSLESKQSYSQGLQTFILIEVGHDCCNSDLAGSQHLKWSGLLTACRLWQIQLLLQLWQIQSLSSIPSINCWRINCPRTLLPPCHLSFCVSSLSLLFPGQAHLKAPCGLSLPDPPPPVCCQHASSCPPSARYLCHLTINHCLKTFHGLSPSTFMHEKSFSRNLYLAHWQLAVPFWTNPSLGSRRKFYLSLTVAFRCDYCHICCFVLPLSRT